MKSPNSPNQSRWRQHNKKPSNLPYGHKYFANKTFDKKQRKQNHHQQRHTLPPIQTSAPKPTQKHVANYMRRKKKSDKKRNGARSKAYTVHSPKADHSRSSSV